MNVVLVVVIVAAAIALGFWVSSRRRLGPKLPKVKIEFWIYSPVADRPSDSAILKRVLGENPHRAGLGKKEGLVLSDIRFHIGVAKSDANPFLFHPEVLAEPDADVPGAIARLMEGCETMFRVTYISEAEVDARSPLQFCWHATDAITEICGSRLVFDTIAQRFWPERTLYEALADNPDAARFDTNVSIRWAESPDDATAFSRGMTKLGLPDIEMRGVPIDHKTVALFLVEAVARRLWDEGWTNDIEIDGFGETFIVRLSEPKPDASGRRLVTDAQAVRRLRG